MKKHPSGLILSRDYTRRESLQLLGMGMAASIASPVMAKSSDMCVLTPELTVGPYYVAKEKVRNNITEGKPGTPLLLRVTVLDSMTCKPVKNAAVDLWHCDARGYYSGYTANDPDGDMFGGGVGGPAGGGPRGERPEGPPPNGGPRGGGEMQFDPPTDQLTFFRGVQFTNAKGVAEFTTIYPGWYFGRAIHIHMSVHSGAKLDKDIISGGHVCHTGQLGFPDEMTDRIATLAPYTNRKLVRTRNNEDSVFTAESLSLGMVTLKPRSSKDLNMGFVGDVAVTVDPAVTPKAAPMAGGPPREQRG